jgi:hypothetical protein
MAVSVRFPGLAFSPGVAELLTLDLTIEIARRGIFEFFHPAH